MSERRSPWLWLLPAALASVALLLVWHRSSSESPPPIPSSDPSAPASPEASPQAPEAVPRAVPARVSAAAPAGCPEDDADPAGFVRPSVWELLRTRTQELRDRLPQLSRDASPSLRDGLNALGGDDSLRALDRIRAAPDRHRDGFDIALAATLHLGMRALARGTPADAQYWARIAVREGPDDPLAHAFAALAANRAGRSVDAAAEMGRAYAGATDEPAIALEHARLEAEHGRFDEAARAVEQYLAEVPEDSRLTSWRIRMAARAELTRTHARREHAGIFVIWPDRNVDSRRVDEVTSAARGAMQEVASRTGLATRAHLTIVIYRSVDELRRATCAPSWSGGIFDGVLQLDAAAIERPTFTRTVRHEAAHAQLAMLRRRIPTWLNEGLAQDMEGPPSPGARAAWRRMVERGFWIPLESLEGELIVIDDPTDAGLAYHQSLAMFLYLDERGPEGALRDAIGRIEAGQPEDLLPALVPGTDGEALLAFMRRRLDAPH